MIDGVDHIGIVTEDVDALALQFAALFERGGGPRMEHAGLVIRFIELGPVHVELIEPVQHPSIERFLERDGPGLHHLALRCEDFDAAVATLATVGVEPLADTPDRGVHGDRICFLPPAATGGTLIELVEQDG